jgi:hypothetical protein
MKSAFKVRVGAAQVDKTGGGDPNVTTVSRAACSAALSDFQRF